MPESPEFILGMKAEAERLAALGIDVGKPLEAEQAIHDVPGGKQIAAYQETERGLFFYSTEGNTVHFLEAAGR